MSKFNGVWIGWMTEAPTGIDASVYLTYMTARPDTDLDMSKFSNTPAPSGNKLLMNIGGVWEGGAQNNWDAFFTAYKSGGKIKEAMSHGNKTFSGVVLDLETADGYPAKINLDDLKTFIENCKSEGLLCFVTCMSGETADYVKNLDGTGTDGVIPMLYNGSFVEAYITNWKAAAAVTGAPLIAGIAYKYKEHYTFLNDTPSPDGLFVWGYGNGGGNASGEECQTLIDQYGAQ